MLLKYYASTDSTSGKTIGFMKEFIDMKIIWNLNEKNSFISCYIYIYICYYKNIQQIYWYLVLAVQNIIIHPDGLHNDLHIQLGYDEA